ncbi:hypothetical protein M0Q97_08740 [Candidatus Dojkabacteria bacterium]|jgi:hypothetical protein|nr:hypothetical protein [Candidatus Dojkabacteria bacterium]
MENINMDSIIQIINEVVQKFINEFSDDWENEPSIADKIYAKRGITTQQSQDRINAELIGYVDKQWNKPINPIPVYKNPKNLIGFLPNTRAVLLNNGDLYVAQSYNALHDNILDLLANKNIIPIASKFNYDKNYPENFIAVVRASDTTTFGESSAYDYFPEHYIEIFDAANQKQPYIFKQIND